MINDKMNAKKLAILGLVWGAIAVGIYELAKSKPSTTTSSTTTPSTTTSSTTTPSTTTSSTTTPSTAGNFSNPLIFDNGYTIPAYYKFTTAEFNNILNANAHGITTGISTNPAYIGSSYYYYDITQWVNYTASPTTTSPTTTSPTTTTSTTTTSTTTSPTTTSPTTTTSTTTTSTNATSTTSSAKGTITISPITITRTPNTGQIITIEGFGFPDNSTGYISASNIEISGFTADTDGKFSVSVQNTMTTSQVSGLYNAIYDTSGNSMSISAYDYGNDQQSNIVNVELD